MTYSKETNKLLFDELMQEQLPTIQTTGGKFSLGIVNNINGKRVTISKALCERLELTNSVDVIVSAKTGKLVLGKKLPFPGASTMGLSGTGKKIIYSAPLVQLTTDAFKLDFSKRTSCTFGNINFDECEGIPVAVVSIA